jgi:hypothetical protein
VRPLLRCHRLQVTLTTQAHIPDVDQHPDHGRRRRPNTHHQPTSTGRRTDKPSYSSTPHQQLQDRIWIATAGGYSEAPPLVVRRRIGRQSTPHNQACEPHHLGAGPRPATAQICAARTEDVEEGGGDGGGQGKVVRAGSSRRRRRARREPECRRRRPPVPRSRASLRALETGAERH